MAADAARVSAARAGAAIRRTMGFWMLRSSLAQGGACWPEGWLRVSRMLHPGRPAQPTMPQFAVFFSDGAGFGIEMAQALDAGHAQDIARAQHPTGRLSAVPAELLNGHDRHKLLAAWLRGEG